MTSTADRGVQTPELKIEILEGSRAVAVCASRKWRAFPIAV